MLDDHPDADAFVIGEWAWDRTELEVASAAHLIGPEATHSAYVSDQWADPVPAIVDYSERLAARGVTLLVVPVPPRPFVYPDSVRGGAFRKSAYGAPHDEFLGALEDRGVQVIDVLPVLRKKSYNNPTKFVNVHDQHWTGHGVVAASREVAKRLEALGVRGKPMKTQKQWYLTGMSDGLGDRLGQPRPDVVIRTISDMEGKRLSVRNPDSPVTVIGDSNLGWYQNLKSGFQEQITHELGYAVDAFVVHGGGATRVRETFNAEVARNPGYLASREVVVWMFMEGTAVRRNWEITPLEVFPPTRLERLRAPMLEVTTDRWLIQKGRSDSEFTKQWFPAPTSEDRCVWLRGTNGEYHFEADEDEAPSSIIIEAKAWPKAPEGRTFAVRLNTVPVGRIEPSTDRNTRHRLELPADALVAGRNTLDFVGRPRDLSATIFTVALVDVLLVDSERIAIIDDPFEGKTRVAEIEIPVVPERAILRWRARIGTREKSVREVSLVVNGQTVVADLAVTKNWAEGAALIPQGLLNPGTNVIERLGSGRLLWDFVEIDG